MILIAVAALPFLAMMLSWLPLGRRFAPAVTLVSSAAAFSCTVRAALEVIAGHAVTALPGWVAIDGLSALILAIVTMTGMTAALFSWGYMARRARSARSLRFYYVHFNLFLFALTAVPLVVEPNLAWIALELTALFSVLLVAFENTHEALEAAWKYIVLMVMGAAIALFGFLILFWAFRLGGGETYTWEGLRSAAPRMSPVLVKTAFLMTLVGFGAKVGLVPVHTWLPDAHSQAPSPVCALLSGVKTTVALYVILRLAPLLPRQDMETWLLTAGLVSAGTAALLLLRVRDYKRLFAFSTVEHMGIIFAAAGLGAATGASGAMLQLVSHAVTKSFCFFAAGAAVLAVETREIASVRGLIRTSPAAGAALLFGGLAIAGAPPFAVFLSEFSILRSGLAQGHYLAVTLLVLFIAVAFFGIMMPINRMVFGHPGGEAAPPQGGLPPSCLFTLILAAAPVLVFGVYLPEPLHELLRLATAALAR